MQSLFVCLSCICCHGTQIMCMLSHHGLCTTVPCRTHINCLALYCKFLRGAYESHNSASHHLSNLKVDEFHFYCRPKVNPILSSFCTSLTGITQVPLCVSLLFPTRRTPFWTIYLFSLIGASRPGWGLRCRFAALRCMACKARVSWRIYNKNSLWNKCKERR